MGNENVTVSLGKAEALILFELLADFYSQPILEIKDNAERLALGRLHGALESTLIEPFAEDYKEILNRARADLIEQWGSVD